MNKGIFVAALRATLVGSAFQNAAAGSKDVDVYLGPCFFTAGDGLNILGMDLYWSARDANLEHEQVIGVEGNPRRYRAQIEISSSGVDDLVSEATNTRQHYATGQNPRQAQSKQQL